MRQLTKEEIVDLVDKTVERKLRDLLDGNHEARVAMHQRRAAIFGEGSTVAKRCDLMARMVEIAASDR